MKEIHVYQVDDCEVWATKMTKEEVTEYYNKAYEPSEPVLASEVTELELSKIVTIQGKIETVTASLEVILGRYEEEYNTGDLTHYTAIEDGRKDSYFLENPIIIYWNE